MKRFLVILLGVFLLAAAPAAAQKHRSNGPASRAKMWKEMQEFKMKYLAQEMELKENQQKQFFELYAQMSEEKKKLFKETRELENKLRDDANATDEDFTRVSNAINAAKERDAAIDKKYDAKFAAFLTPRQIFRMKAAEEKFRDKMRDMRHKKKRNRK